MGELVSLNEIVERSYNQMGIYIEEVRSHGFPFDYQLSIDHYDYPLEFTPKDKRTIGGHFIDELILNALKSILKIRELEDIRPKRYDTALIKKRVPRISISLEVVGDEYVISVQDNGPGIAPENHERIWEDKVSTFGTTGTGLALIWEEIVEYYGGRTEVKSVPNFETVFTLYIPKPRNI